MGQEQVPQAPTTAILFSPPAEASDPSASAKPTGAVQAATTYGAQASEHAMQAIPSCASYRHAVELVGRRWSGVIIQALLGGVKRFGELRDSVPDLSDRMLSERLKELESEGIVERIVIPEMPVRIEYHLTPKGRDLVSVVEAVTSWANRWLEPTGE